MPYPSKDKILSSDSYKYFLQNIKSLNLEQGKISSSEEFKVFIHLLNRRTPLGLAYTDFASLSNEAQIKGLQNAKKLINDYLKWIKKQT